MAIKGRQWSDLEQAMAEYFTQLRNTSDKTPSYRRISADTGMTHSRIMDIFRQKNGTPTLLEFMLLCRFFNKDPADVLRELEHETTFFSEGDDRNGHHQ